MPKFLFAKTRIYEFKDLIQNATKPRRFDILSRKRRRKDIQCIRVHQTNDETYSSQLSSITGRKHHPTLEKLLSDKTYLSAFRAFLLSEFSEENMDFWLACEDFRATASLDDLCWKAQEIYQEFIRPTACREINVDHHVREKIRKSLEKPSLSCFDEAQKQVYLLMERDSWSRFLCSDAYRSLEHKTRTLWYL
ncbi:regulator of G-protein signaling 21 [Genypterus blacodes]|uniref:regulator of G-protein signaling 21 n=1 Tax=Genypterus blacodes TaxID=154954 RepID=UPI003F76CE0E